MNSARRPAGYRRNAMRLLMWLGIALCIAAIVRYWKESSELLSLATPARVLILVGLLVLVWSLAVRHWQLTVLAFTGARLEFRDAARHLAYLLLGKYLPGGVWGFLARHADSSVDQPGGRMLVAGIAEQWVSLASLASAALLAMLVALRREWAWLLMVLLIPIATAASFSIAYQLIRATRRLFTCLPAVAPDWGGSVLNQHVFRRATSVSLLQQSLVMGVVLAVAQPAYDLDLLPALGIAGSYGAAAAAGILTVVVPGGIFVREAVFVGFASAWLTVPQAIALAASLRLVFTAFDLICGILARLPLPRSHS